MHALHLLLYSNDTSGSAIFSVDHKLKTQYIVVKQFLLSCESGGE